MVVDQIRQIDTSGDNKINDVELREAMKPNGFLSKEENLKKVGELLNSGDTSGLDQELLNSLEQSFYALKGDILNKERITDEDKIILEVYKRILGGKCGEEIQEIDNFIANQEELRRQDEEEQRLFNSILQEIETEIFDTENDYIENLKSLGINPKTQFKRNNLVRNIKSINDLEKIDGTNIASYLKIPEGVLNDYYEFIANNVKFILNRHLQLHPDWKTTLGKGGYSTGMNIDNLWKDDAYMTNIIHQVQILEKKDITQQVLYCINKLPNGDFLDLWLKRVLNDKNNKQEDILKKVFDKITPQQSDKFFQACEKNGFINELKNNYAIYWLKKYDSIKTDGGKYCFLDWTNKSKFENFYGKGIKLSDDLNFDNLYSHTKNFYTEIQKFGFDTTIPLSEIIKFLNAQDNYYKKIKNASDICERETKYAADSYNPNYMPVGGSPSAGHAHLGGEIHAAKVKFQSEKSKACAELEKEYVKVLLQKKPKPIGDIMGISGAGIALKFDKDPGRGTLDERADKIVRDTFTEQLGDQREKFKYDLKNDRQAAFGSAMGMIGGIAGSAAAAIFTKNIWATSAGFTAGLRLGNGIGQEIWNSGEFLYEQVSGNKINDGNNKVENFGQGFLRGVGALDQNYEYVGTAKFLSGLGFDYLSTVATFGLSQKFGGFLGKLEGVKFAGGALKFGMEELILENFFVDIPMNIVQSGFEAFTGIDNGGVTVGNTSMGNERTVKGENPYQSGSLSDMLRAMKDATTQNLSFENLSQTFFNTVVYGGFLEGGGAAIKKMKGYLPSGQVSNFTERSAAASAAFVGLTNFMSSKNINFNKDGVCIDTKTNLKIEESDPRFKELISHIKAVEVTKAGIIESFETIMETQKQMVSDPENKTGLLFRLGLISPTNTPLNILKKKKELVEKKLNEAKSKGDNTKIAQLEKLLDIYTDAENKLNTNTEGESIQFNSSEQISPLVSKIDNSVFERVINSQELKQIASQEIENGTLEIGENGEILNVYVEVNGEKRPSKLFQSLINGGLSSEQALKSRLQTRTTEFKEWFGDWQNDPENASKIVDENGEPLVMWHGTTRQFNEFSHDAPRNYENIGNTKDWFYFSNAYNFTEKEYSGIGQINQALTDFYSLYAENYEGNDRLENFTNKRNYFIEGLSNGKTEKKNSNLRFEGKENQINQQLAYCLNGQELKIENFEKREWIRKVECEDGEIESIPVKIYVPKGNVYNNPLPFFIKGNNISQGNDFTRNQVIPDMDYNINKAIENGNNETDIIRVDDKSTGNIVLGVKDATQIKSAIGNDGTFSPESGKFNDYFGKKPKLAKNIDSTGAYNNSEKMDNYLSQIQENGENLGAILTELREEINKEYKSVTNTDKDLNLTDEQLLSVLDAHEKDGILGELTLGQLRQKVKILDETITDPKVRRFLLEAGFCGKVEINNKINIDAENFEIPLKEGKCEYASTETGKSAENVTKEQAKECFFNGLDVTAQLMEGQSQRSVLSSGSLFLNNPEFMKLGGDIDVATDVQTFRNVALEKQSNGKTKLDQFLAEGKIKDLKFTHIGQNHKEIDIKTINESELNLLIAQGDIRVEFNIPSDGIMINCEFFPEPKGYGLIQLGTTRTEGKVNTYTINGREVKTVNEELAAMSYMINLAHEIDNNCIEGIQKGKKLKDSVRINNFLQYLSSIGLNTPHEIIEFIDKTKKNYESQTGEVFTINKNGENTYINMSDYLRTGINKLERIREILTVMEGDYNKTVLLDESWGSETTISFNQFMKETFTIKKGLIDGSITIDEAIEKVTALQLQIDIKNPKNFAYYYEIYQLRKEFEGKIVQIERTSVDGENGNLTTLRNIEESEFQDISTETLTEMGNELRDTFGSTNYDSFDLYLRLIRNRKSGETLRDSFRTLDLSGIDKSKGTICTGMARLLQTRLSKKGVRSHMIRFQAGGTQNNEYLGDGHTALIVPRKLEDGSLGYTLLDPGLLISQPLTFGKGENPTVDASGARYKIVYTGNSEYPFSMQQYKINKETQQYELKKEMPFNPNQEWLNPEQTLNTEILRVFTDFKIAKQDTDGNNLALIRLTIGTKTIDIRYKGCEKMPELTIDEFRNIKNSPRYQDFIKACEILGRNPDVMYNELMLGIENLDEYTSTIQNISSAK